MGRLRLLAVAGLTGSALAACTFDPSALGQLVPDGGFADGSRPDGTPVDAVDAAADLATADGTAPVEAGADAAPDSAPDAAQADSAPVCSGVVVGGFCWYAGAADESCAAACAGHGGCNLAGTQTFAGSSGTDANCVAVLAALGYGGYRHQSWSNNDLGCHFAWPTDPWTYWSQAAPTTCDAAYPGTAQAVRMCACNR